MINVLITKFTVSYIAVEMYSRDRYEIIGLREISHFIKQPCRNVFLEKALYCKCSKVAETIQYVG